MPTTIFVYIKTSHFAYASKITFFKVFLLDQQQVIAYTSTTLTYPFVSPFKVNISYKIVHLWKMYMMDTKVVRNWPISVEDY